VTMIRWDKNYSKKYVPEILCLVR